MKKLGAVRITSTGHVRDIVLFAILKNERQVWPPDAERRQIANDRDSG